MSAPINENILQQIEKQKQLRQQQQVSQQLPSQTPTAPSSPPNEATAKADAALLAAQQVQAQAQQRAAQREQEALSATQSLDEADRYEQNAQMAQQAAQDSTLYAQQKRQEADQLAQMHQQEAAEEEQQLAVAQEQAEDAEVARVVNDPQVLQQVKPDLAEAVGVNVKEIDAEVENTFREVQGIFSGQLDVNNQRQVALAEKIKAGEGFNKQEKIALGMAALLPIIVGAATGKLGQGLQAAGALTGQLAAQKQAEVAQAKQERGQLEDRELQVAQGKLKNVGLFADQKGKVSAISIAQAEAAEESTQKELQNKGIKLNNVARLEKAKQEKVLTKSKIADFNQKIEKIANGELGADGGKISGDQRKAATFTARMEQAEDIFGVLESSGFSPVEGEGWTPNRLKREERQKYEQAQRNFVNAVLRRESGAAIAESEFDSADKQYFPQPGDTPEVIAQKTANRAIAIAGLKAEAGDGAMNALYKALGELQPHSQVQQSAQAAPAVDLSQMSDEELQRIIQGGQ
jgi:roadblock/LC7 domain-containing protein